LLEHLRLCRETITSDAILLALLQAKYLGSGIVERLFILAFLPSMHGSLRQVAKRYPQLSPDDASQQALQSLLRFLDSAELRTRKAYLGFAISRRVKRAIFEWAEREIRAGVFEPEISRIDQGASSRSFERLALLRHFLDRAVRRSLLSAAELDLLIQSKLEKGAENGLAASSNAHRQRLKRVLSKLRRLANGRSPRRQNRVHPVI
jgi:hypothetical protein